MPKFNKKLLSQIPRAYIRATEKKVISIALDIKNNKLIIDPQSANVTLTAGQTEIQWQSKNAPLTIRFLGGTPFLAKSFPCASSTGCLSGVPIKGLVKPGVYDYLIEARYFTPNKTKTKLVTVDVPPVRLQVTVI